MKPFEFSTAAVAVTVLLLGPVAASAGTPSDVSDLVGARGSSGEMELGQRGYSNVTMSHGVQYWWNASTKACIGIKVSQGRYKSVSAASASKCNQSAKAKGSGSEVSSNAKTACMEAVNRNYGGKVRDLVVTSSEFSQANSQVNLKAMGVRGGSSNETWKCLVSNDGKVQDLNVVGN